MKTLLTWLLSLACLSAGAQPTIRLASAQVFNRGAYVASGFGSCGTFTLQQFIRTSTADGTNAETTGGFDSTGIALEVINVAASNTAPITVYNASSNVWVAGRPVTNGTFVFQQFFCTNVIATNGDQFVAECTNAGPVLQVYLFTCTGQPVFDGQSAGGGGTGSASYQPGSITPFSGTELFVVGIGANEGYSSIDSSFATELGDTAGNVSIGTSYKNSSSAENPTLTLSASGTASASMLMFGSVNCTPSSSPLVTAQTLGTARTDTQAGAGITFVAASAVTIDHLGRWVYSGNTGTHTVSLENAAGTVLTSASVNTTLGTPGQYLEVSCTPFTLVIGTRYFIVSTEGGDTFGDEAAVTADATVVGSGPNAWNSAFVSGGVPQVNSADESYVPVNALWH